ncbi:uncharacterized protein LOC121878061 [Homarus americanus]|uniref:uncharacterized protein LOC121878061 n=1 Tax=Homarus americanus TaxID=6706 RepID=UPI001C43E743|nr:uncharacterized protein LOC121878061 [Homarus americanus]XP_042239973.1 uncharacterized protein LOC121878061 [Homarus americanus]
MDNTATVLKAVVATIWLLGVAHLISATTYNECKFNKLPETKDQGTLYTFEDKKLKGWIRTVGTAVLNLSVGNDVHLSGTIGNSSDIKLDKWNQIVIEQIAGDDGYTYSVSILDNTKWHSSKKQFPGNCVFPSSPGSKIWWSTCPPDDLMDMCSGPLSKATPRVPTQPPPDPELTCSTSSTQADRPHYFHACIIALPCLVLMAVVAFVFGFVSHFNNKKLVTERGRSASGTT